jgi:Ras GTPase-activating-like protein IQGAP2/3
MLQNLANKPTYAKESYMIPTNPFVTANKQRINKFLNDLCEVSDFYESLEMDQYMALSRKDIYINITPNELYSTQALISQHLHRLAPDPTHHLRILLQDLGPTPKQVPRQTNKPIKLPLYSRWETSPLQQQPLQEEQPPPDSDLAVYLSPFSENNITQNDIMYMETKSMFVQIMRSMPHTMKLYTATSSSSLDLIRVAEAASTAKDAQLVNKGLKVQSMLQDLEEAGIVSRTNHYELLVQEIQQELNHLGDLKDHVVLEIESLEQVVKTIQDHNNYLQSQLETYKAYLQNVRMQSSGNIDGGSGRRKSSLVAAVGFTQAGPGHTSSAQQQQQPQLEHLAQTNTTSNISLNTTSANIVTSSNSNSSSSSSSSIIKKKPSGPFKFSHQQLEKEGIIVHSEVPEYRRANIYLMIQSPIIGTFVISLHYKGREKPVLEIDLKLDDLLEKVCKTRFR